MTELPTLCLIPKDTWIQPDWTSLGFDKGLSRRLHICLTSIFTYEDNKMLPISDWRKTIDECGLMVEQYQSFRELKSLFSDIISEQTGLYVYDGVIHSFYKQRHPDGRDIGKYNYKTCYRYPSAEYAASISTDLKYLWRFDPDIAYNLPFMIGWFGESDPLNTKLKDIYSNWPDSLCRSMLPAGPSPSESSIELVGIGDDNGMIGLFGDLLDDSVISPESLRRILGEDTIFAEIDADRFIEWLDSPHLDVLEPVDRPLPFHILD